MKEKNISVTLEKAQEWYNSDDATLRDLALQAFSRDEIIYPFYKIKSTNDACAALGLDYRNILVEVKSIEKISKASAAMFQLNIIRKALNLGHDLHLAKNPGNSCIYYPYNPFTTKSYSYYKNELSSGRMEVIGKVKSEGEVYDVLGGGTAYGSNNGLGCFSFNSNVGFADVSFGSLGCASKEIAQHFGKYFGMLITKAKYADMVDFEIIENRYCYSIF